MKNIFHLGDGCKNILKCCEKNLTPSECFSEQQLLISACRLYDAFANTLIVLFLQYVDHIKFCSKFRTPCRFHVVGCDMSVSILLCHIFRLVIACISFERSSEKMVSYVFDSLC